MSTDIATYGAVGSGSIMIVDDDDIYRRRVCKALTDRGYSVEEVAEPATLLATAPSPSVSAAIVDLRMPCVSGLDVVSALIQCRPDLAIVVVTGYGSIATALEAVRRGARSYLTKPVGINQMLDALVGSTAEYNKPLSVPSLARVEWEHIHAVLRSCDGNISQAAKLLGIHRRSLQRKLKGPPK